MPHPRLRRFIEAAARVQRLSLVVLIATCVVAVVAMVALQRLGGVAPPKSGGGAALSADFPWWFFLALMATELVAKWAAWPLARAWVRRQSPPRQFADEPMCTRPELMGRMWPFIVMASYTLASAAVTIFGMPVLLMFMPVDWPFVVMGVILTVLSWPSAFNTARGEVESGLTAGFRAPPDTGDLWYVEAGFQERICRYRRWVAYFEEHGLHDPSPDLYTDAQRSNLRKGYDDLLAYIEAWERGEMRPHPGADLSPTSKATEFRGCCCVAKLRRQSA